MNLDAVLLGKINEIEHLVAHGVGDERGADVDVAHEPAQHEVIHQRRHMPGDHAQRYREGEDET